MYTQYYLFTVSIHPFTDVLAPEVRTIKGDDTLTLWGDMQIQVPICTIPQGQCTLYSILYRRYHNQMFGMRQLLVTAGRGRQLDKKGREGGGVIGYGEYRGLMRPQPFFRLAEYLLHSEVRLKRAYFRTVLQLTGASYNRLYRLMVKPHVWSKAMGSG